MSGGRPVILTLLVIGAATGVARADSISVDGVAWRCKVNGLRDGLISYSVDGQERLVDPGKVEALALDDVPKLAEAESARAEDAKKSAALYKQLIPTINNARIKALVELRAIAPTDADGRWVEAVNLFLEVYQGNPGAGVWQARPTHLPAPGSSLLKDSAERVAGAIKAARTAEVRGNLRGFLLDIYNRDGDTASAARLAREMTTGVGEEGGGAARGKAVGAVTEAVVERVERAVQSKDYAAAVKEAEAALATTDGETAVRLYQLEAEAYAGANRPDDAVAAYLRIAAYYPGSAAAPGALLAAAEMQEKLKRPAAAERLRREVVARYPDSPEAAQVSGK